MLKKLEQQEKKLFEKLFDAIGVAIGGYILFGVLLKGFVHIMEFIASFYFYAKGNLFYMTMDRWADKIGNICSIIGIIVSIIGCIYTIFIGYKYFKLVSRIRQIKKSNKKAS